MKTKLITMATISSLFLFTGCSNKELSLEEKEEVLQSQKEEFKKEIETLPSWVLKPEVKNSISVIGMSNFSKHGLHSMLAMAEMDARAKLAGKINTLVSRLQEKSMRSLQIEKIDELEEVFTQVTKELIKEVQINNAKRVNLYQGNDGTLYVLMSMDNTVLNELKDNYSKHIKDANISKKNLDTGMMVLDKMIDSLEEELN